MASGIERVRAPMVLSVHGPGMLSGVTTWAARMVRRSAEQFETTGGTDIPEWKLLVVGAAPGKDQVLAIKRMCGDRDESGAAGARVLTAQWGAGASAVDRVRAVANVLAGVCMREASSGGSGRAVVVHANDSAAAVAAAALCRHRGARLVLACHAEEARYAHFMETAACEGTTLVDAWWAPSDGTRALARAAMGMNSGGEVLPYGERVGSLPTPFTAPGDESGIKLVSIGRLDRFQKRSGDLVALADALQSRGVRFVLTVIGDGPARAWVERAADDRGHVRAGRMRFVGAMEADEVAGALVEHHALVMTSRFEGTPLVGMEALALGRPVFGTLGVGGLVEAGPGCRGVVLTPVGDMAAMAERIARICNKDILATLGMMGTEAHAAALRLFDMDRIGPRYDRLMRGAAEVTLEGDAGARWRVVLQQLREMAVGDGVDVGDVEGLARWWATHGGPASDGVRFHEGIGAIPTLQERLMLRAIEDARGAIAGREAVRAVVYPGGAHTRRIGPGLRSMEEVVGIVDDAAGDAGCTLHGKPVVVPERAATLGYNAVIVSSDEHEDELAARAREWAAAAGRGGEQTPIVRMYYDAGGRTLWRRLWSETAAT